LDLVSNQPFEENEFSEWILSLEKNRQALPTFEWIAKK
jgi:hypothetical protein